MLAVALIFGLPQAGRTSLADAVEAEISGFTRVPLDRYIRPIPAGATFLEWLADPRCIGWEDLVSHLQVLESGRICYSPRQDWANRGVWVSQGGAIESGPGRRMKPASSGYLLAGNLGVGVLRAGLPNPADLRSDSGGRD